MKHPNHNKAQFKYNGGRGALICSGCRVILKTGDQYTEEEIEAAKGYAFMEAQYCLKCKLINILNDAGMEWKENIVVRDDVKYRVISFPPQIPAAAMEIIQTPGVITYGYLTSQYEPGIDVYFKM
jgi:hypothetical protein